MKNFIIPILFVLYLQITEAQVSSIYSVSFENAIHHEAQVNAVFKNLKTDEVEFRMSRTSPGRYALHEFVKNIYDVKVTDSKGNQLKTYRPNPYAWNVNGHDGEIHVTYTLFANRGDGTYAQIDETHAHLNIPATFIYVPSLSDNEFEVTFNIREDLNWKIATQLKHLEGNKYVAKNLQYFMDSPTEISDFSKKSFKIDGQNINFVLHHNGTEAEFNEYFKRVEKIVIKQKEVFGELPQFDHGAYTFLACYIPNASGDGMEHRNSTILTSTRSLAKGGLKSNLGTVSHEFFHCWNVERIRPKSLEPFDFEEANMSGELWFAEGFTSYYTNLILCRAGLIDQKEYINSLQGSFNYVWNSPGRMFFNPIEMSYQAPFVDAAKSVDEVNRGNTFISYYTYGSMLGLALDLSLRQKNLNLDNYMKLVWTNYGKKENSYEIKDLHHTLNTYAGKEFGDDFFENFIYNSKMPDYMNLFKSVGVILSTNETKVSFGVSVKEQYLTGYPKINSSAYNAGLTKGDKILQIESLLLNDKSKINKILSTYKPDDILTVIYQRNGFKKETEVTLKMDPNYSISIFDQNGDKTNKKVIEHRNKWLHSSSN